MITLLKTEALHSIRNASLGRIDGRTMPRMPSGMRPMYENKRVAYLTACKCSVGKQFSTERCIPDGMRYCATVTVKLMLFRFLQNNLTALP